MSFTNAQFEQIKRIYDERRMLNGQESDRRLEYAEKTIPGFSKIRDRMVSLSMEMAKKLALGEETTCEEYKKEYPLTPDSYRRVLHKYDTDILKYYIKILEFSMFLDKYSFAAVLNSATRGTMNTFEIIFNSITSVLMFVSVIAAIFSGWDYIKGGKDLLKDM